ncbi:MAG: hypothetical protein NZ524_03580 [Thiobacillaceae bacterium]|nr:hypothetical protein [Thiobacillaceae bacterium]MDW8324144.1 hypothetical protein [Burkholderiales bacterium]
MAEAGAAKARVGGEAVSARGCSGIGSALTEGKAGLMDNLG